MLDGSVFLDALRSDLRLVVEGSNLGLWHVLKEPNPSYTTLPVLSVPLSATRWQKGNLT